MTRTVRPVEAGGYVASDGAGSRPEPSGKCAGAGQGDALERCRQPAGPLG